MAWNAELDEVHAALSPPRSRWDRVSSALAGTLVNFSIDAEIRWPIVIFEMDWYGIVVPSAVSVSGLYEDTYWDEIRAAFDSSFHPVVFRLDGSEVTIERDHDPNPEGFRVAARLSLATAFRETRWRRIPATYEERRQLEKSSANELMSSMLNRGTA